VSPYLGSEIVGAEQLDLFLRKTYLLFRPGAELKRAAPSAVGIPVLSRHEPVDAVDYAPNSSSAASSDARFEPPHLVCSIAVWAADAIDNIESGKNNGLSAGHRYEPVMEAGVSPDGERHDRWMKRISLNHIALCRTPRIGAEWNYRGSGPGLVD
jgi:uncharacterized protein